jgi:hypothetical protein
MSMVAFSDVMLSSLGFLPEHWCKICRIISLELLTMQIKDHPYRRHLLQPRIDNLLLKCFTLGVVSEVSALFS